MRAAAQNLGRRAAQTEPARVALLGTGNVGRAVLARLAGWESRSPGDRLSLVYAANSRSAVWAEAGLCPHAVQSLASAASPSPLGRGVGVRVRQSCDGELPDQPSARSLCSCFGPAPSPGPHPPLDHSLAGGVFGHLLPTAEGKNKGRADLDHVMAHLGKDGSRVLIDATASESVAERHAHWLAQGVHVVTACKLGQGTGLARWRAIRAACASGSAVYGDAATVGAGLPLLRSLRDLQAGGDRIHAIAGVLSGSLAWLFNHYDGRRPFSRFVREARAVGYAEPDPREDLSGEDVRRKLLILARAAGVELEADVVAVESLVPAELAAPPMSDIDAVLPMLDAPLRQRFAEAWKHDRTLRFIARLEPAGRGWTARVGLESLPADHPLGAGAGTDNRVAIWSDRYREQPLVIQGPGAGAEVTAAALLDDVLRVTARSGIL